MFEHFLIGKFPRQQNPRQYYPEKCDDPVAERWADWGVVGSRRKKNPTPMAEAGSLLAAPIAVD